MKFEIDEKAVEEAHRQNVLAREERKKNPPPELIHLQKTTSLQQWIYRCEKAGIKYIDAKFCPIVIPIKDIFDALDHKEVPDNISLVEKWLRMEWKRWEGLGQEAMWRWDCCAPYSLKGAMAHSEEYHSEPILELDDPRFIDIMYYDTHRDDMSVCVRPWIEAEYYSKYPVEFRVFAFRDKYNNNEYAVSNYYPQRDLPQEYYDYAVECEKLASKLSQTENFENGFTADFMLTAERKIVFIEGGPAWGYGADPCCIDPKKMHERRVVLANEFDRGDF